MKKTKSFLAILLTFVVLLTSVSASAFAADDRLPLAVFPHFLVAFDLHIVSPPPVYVNGGRNRRRIVVSSSV